MGQPNPTHGIGTLVNHVGEGDTALNAHVSPIFQTSAFSFPDVATGAAIFKGEEPGYNYTRFNNPNQAQLVAKIAALEGLDLLRAQRAQPDLPANQVVDGRVFSTGMSAITSAMLASLKQGDTVIVQEAVYGATFSFFKQYAPRYGIQVVWLSDPNPAQWEQAFAANPQAVLAYLETPANPLMCLVDIHAVAEIAHRYGAMVFVDNTFASPYTQRPLTLGADVVLHSTTKYLSGHGAIVGGAVVSRRVDWVNGPLTMVLRTYGASAAPFDCWLANMGLKTFELRMQRHCENGLRVARYLESNPKVGRVFYPGLESHPDYALACRQMSAFGGMMTFDLRGGLEAGVSLMNAVRLATLAVSLGNTDTLISHPASMTHSNVPREERLKTGVTDGLVRLSVGIENPEDILADLDQALAIV